MQGQDEAANLFAGQGVEHLLSVAAGMHQAIALETGQLLRHRRLPRVEKLLDEGVLLVAAVDLRDGGFIE